MPLSAYCQSYKNWRDAIEAIEQASPSDQPTLMQIARNAANDAVKFACQLGLSPSTRLRGAAAIEASRALAG
jgi:phage terminase small subunit